MSPLDELLFLGALVFYMTDFRMTLIVFFTSFILIFTVFSYLIRREVRRSFEPGVASLPIPLWINTIVALVAIGIAMVFTTLLA